MSMSTSTSTSTSTSDLDKLATLLKTGQATRIVVLAGAGISTAAGIPDFRTPNTGLYAKLAPLKLPYPEAIFTLSYFRHTPEPFYALAHARHPRNLTPTLSHAFLGLLARKGLLHFIFTQNIDCLEEAAGVPSAKVLNVHGNWKTQRCCKCKRPYPDDLMRRAVEAGDVPYCGEKGKEGEEEEEEEEGGGCGGVVKPDVVFFGESLPAAFEVCEREMIPEADLMLVMGTSLKVAPVSQVPRKVRAGVPRVLFNNERVGDMGNREEDLCVLGECDEGVRRLAEACGWGEELEALWREIGERKRERDGEFMENGPSLDECIQRIADKMGSKDLVSQGHKKMLEDHLSAKFAGLFAPTKGKA